MRTVLVTVLAFALAACHDGESPSHVRAPGAPAETRTQVLEAGAAALQAAAPVRALNVYLNGFHFYSGEPTAQMEAHHYCSVVNEEVFQCVIYDGSTADAKIMGVEYVISRRLFETLPGQERMLWHSHAHEVKSGQLVVPGVPAAAEHALMEKFVGTYGKTWHTWHTDRELALPLGHPMLMMGFTADGQIDPRLVSARDARLAISATAKRRDRQNIQAPDVLPGADAWQHGDVLQVWIGPRRERTGAHASGR